MKTFLYILTLFIAVAFGLMLYVSVQKDIPEQLAFLKMFGGSVSENYETDPLPGAQESHLGWSLFHDDKHSYVEVRRYDRRARVYVSFGCQQKTTPFMQLYVPDAFALATGATRPVVELGASRMPFVLDIDYKKTNSLAPNPNQPALTPQIAYAQQPAAMLALALKAPNKKIRLNYLLQSDKTFEPSYINIPTEGLRHFHSKLPAACQSSK